LMSQPPSPPALPPEHAQRGWRSAAVRRRRWATALTISAGVHLVALVLYSLATRTFLIPSVGLVSPTTSTSTLDGTRLIPLREVRDPEETTPDEALSPLVPTDPETSPEPSEGIEVGEAEEAQLGPEEEAQRVTNAERLRPPEVGDPRIWRFVDPDLGDLSDAERYQISLWWKLALWYDSLGAAEESERRALDWTYTDDEGGKWGVSPGVIHLGTLTLPLPDFFAVPSTQRERVDRLVQEWEQIERQARTQAVWQSWREAAKEIRERRDRERADTSGIRRR
jgi:hypothetical protein